MLCTKSVFFALLAAMTTGLAQKGVEIDTIDGATIRLKDGTVSTTGTAFFNPGGDNWFQANGDQSRCTVEGTWDGSTAIFFTIKPGDSYLEPCGDNNGVTIVCDPKPATCQG